MPTEEVLQQEKHLKKRSEKKKSKKIWVNILIVILSISVWSGIVYYGYHYAKHYIDTAIKNVQQENAMNIQQLNERIQTLVQEISSLRKNLESTGSTISDSTIVQERIDEKLKNLDNQLNDLERSLEILKEAPNVKN